MPSARALRPRSIPSRSGAAPQPAPRRQVQSFSLGRASAASAAPRSACACGGGCSRCRASARDAGDAPRASAAAGLRLSRAGDAREREADGIAARVAAGERGPFALAGAGRHAATAMSGEPATPAALRPGLASPSRPLDGATRRLMETRLGGDFSGVQVHTGRAAAAHAGALQARAYTAGRHIVFGADEYAPSSSRGQQLLAHELVHVMQHASGASPLDEVQRAPTRSIVDANFIGPLSATQRRAAASCPVSCCLSPIGTLHAMPLFHHASRGAQVASGDAAGTGIGAALHFQAGANQPAAGETCHCDDFRIVQVLETNDPAPGRGGNSYVDNSGQRTPFYSDVFLGGRGEHAIPAGYPDAGERVQTTESIYDRPFRNPATLRPTSLRWRAESCVACVKNGAPDLVLGCTTYGFDRPYNPVAHAFGTVVGVGPNCSGAPSGHFVSTLRGDPTTSAYDFATPPPLSQCFPTGDFPTPSGDTRVA